MGSADFSQFVVTTANETACEISTLKVHALSPHLPATFTGTSSNFWTSSLFADLSVFPSLICGSCSSGQGFAYSFLQIPPRGGHPCCSAMYFVVAYAYSGLSPVRARPWRANKEKPATEVTDFSVILVLNQSPSPPQQNSHSKDQDTAEDREEPCARAAISDSTSPSLTHY